MPITFQLIENILAADPAAAQPTLAGNGLRELFIQISYLAASALFILGLRGLTRPDKARRGMQ
ncbi:MAG: hypothetical protein IIA67_09960, partial [Planctomycetes bacterium]|nr:hypothetical protein [Planctomycetota bacterium]